MCEKHNIQLQETCGIDSCGLCYEEWLNSAPVKLPNLPPISYNDWLRVYGGHIPPVLERSLVV